MNEIEETAEEAAFRTRVRDALSARLRDRPTGSTFTVMGGGTDDVESGRHFLEVLAEGGYATSRWPVEHGGMGATPEQAEIVAQELSRFEVPDLYPFMVGIGLVGPTLMTHGTPEQQARWLPRIRSGEEIWCQLFSEPDAGSDLAGLTSRATFDTTTGVWEVTGSKVWSSRAHYSDWGLLLARSDFSVPKHAGLTAFAIRMDAPGVEVRPLRQMNGDTHFNEVFLDHAPIPDEDRIAGPGEGWRVAITTLMHERGSIGGRMGVSPAEVIELGHERAHDAVARDRLARSISNLEVARFTGLRARAARRQSGGAGVPGPEGSGGKLRMSAVLKELADAALDLHGPEGMLAPTPQGPGNEWKTLFMTAPSLSIRGGTDEIQRNIIGERVLGLPPEPRVDKEKPFSARTD